MLRTAAILALAAALSLTAAAAAPDKLYLDAVAAPGRSDADRERDARDHPAEILAFAGFRPGMKVADLFGGGGYNTELLSRLVGPKGEVVLVNNLSYDSYGAKELGPRLENNRLPNVRHLTVDPADLELAPNSLDGAIIVMSYHDLYWVDEKQGWARIDAGRFLDQVARALKPGGVFVVVDHAARDGTGNEAAQTLHRIDEAFARSDITSHGLVFDGSLDTLRNPGDDRTKLVFDPGIRGKTDRFVHRYRKPKHK